MKGPWHFTSAGRGTVRRAYDWQRLLGSHYSAWHPLFVSVQAPTGQQFVADLGAGQAEYELARDEDGFVAIPLDGVTPVRLNASQAEFLRLDITSALRYVAEASGAAGTVEELGHGLFALGTRTLSGRTVRLFAAPRGVRGLVDGHRRALAPRQGDFSVLMVPDANGLPTSTLESYAVMHVALTPLPVAAPWRTDWSVLVEDEHFSLPLTDPVEVFGARYAVIVDLRQQRIWLEGRELSVRADSQPYRLFAHLAERPGGYVPHLELANKVLESDSEALEATVVKQAKYELAKAIQKCLDPLPVGCRLDAATMISVEKGRAALVVDAPLVKVLRPVSDPNSP